MTLPRRAILPFPLAVAVLWVSSFPTGLHAVETPPPLTAAVFDFQTTGDSLAGKGAQIATLFNAQLSSTAPGLVLVERQELEKTLGEQELGLSGTIAPATAAKVGTLTGAKILVTGRLFEAGGKFFLTAKVIGTETGRVYGESTTFNDLAAMDKAANELAVKVAADIDKRGDTLVAKVETPAERLERLRKLVGGKTPLPSVSVVIAEQHISQFVIDPAAQTEMKLVLQQLGFEVIDPKASNKAPDVEIAGEAFSELAGRHGNLVSCRARVEIRVVRRKDGSGKLLLADRQTDVAVDLAEQVAGKAALENAAVKLLDRVVPTLVSE